VDGVSFAYALGEGSAGEPERHETQYYEMFGSRALYHQGWKAVAFHPIAPLYDDQDPNASFDDDVWELYDVREDLSETRDLAGERPEKLEELVAIWWREAERNQVLPLDNRVLWSLVHPKPDRRRSRDLHRYFPGASQVPESVAVNVRNRSHALIVDATIPETGDADGVLLALGSALGGWSLQILDGRLRYVHNLYGKERHVIEAAARVPAGRHRFEYEFTKDDGAGGSGELRCDGTIVAHGVIDRFTPSGFNNVGAGLTCGYEWGPAVGTGYEAPFRFNGTIERAFVETRGPVVRDPLAELEAILSEQ
jgi:arylsulfatase